MAYLLNDAHEKFNNVPTSRTIKKHRQEGKVSLDKDEKGRWVIDGSELARVYKVDVSELGNDIGKDTGNETELHSSDIGKKHSDTPHNIGNNIPENNSLPSNANAHDEVIRMHTERYEEMKADRDFWRKKTGQIEERYERLLPAPKPAPKNMWLGVGGIASAIILVVGYLGYQYQNNNSKIAALLDDVQLRQIEPAAGSPEEGAQLPFNSLEEDATKN